MLNAFRKICAEPWAMTPEMLELLISISLRENVAVPDIEALRREMGRPVDGTQNAYARGPVGVVPVYGPIFSKADKFTDISGATTTDRIARDLTQMADNPQISSVILDLDSPGGQVAGISELADYIKSYPKPIKAYVSAMAASAGYWLASATNEIVTDKTASLGSIGVVIGVPNVADPKRVDFVSSNAPLKRPDVNLESGRSVFQERADTLGAVFADSVLGFRPNMSGDQLHALAGNIVVGQQAINSGLADRLGSLEGLIAEMSETSTNPWRSDMKLAETSVGRQLASLLNFKVEDTPLEPAAEAQTKAEFEAQMLQAQELLKGKLDEAVLALHNERLAGILSGLEADAVGTPRIRELLKDVGRALPPTAESLDIIGHLAAEVSNLADSKLLVSEVVPGAVILPAEKAGSDNFMSDATIALISRDVEKDKARRAAKR